MLVCGFTNIKVEELKAIRRGVKELGFVCTMQMGWLYISVLKGKKNDWLSLFRLLELESRIVPFYFVEGERIITLEYGKLCLDLPVYEFLGKCIMMGWSKVLSAGLHLNAAVLLNLMKIKENGNNKSINS